MFGSSICCLVCLVLSLPVSGISYIYILSVFLNVFVCVRERDRDLSYAVLSNYVSQYVLFTGLSGSLCGVWLEVITGLSGSVLIACIYFP